MASTGLAQVTGRHVPSYSFRRYTDGADRDGDDEGDSEHEKGHLGPFTEWKPQNIPSETHLESPCNST